MHDASGRNGAALPKTELDRLPSRTLLLCERLPAFARGAAYSTHDPVHLLNVRAANMSAYPDRPAHFLEWLQRLIAQSPDAELAHRIQVAAVGTFVPRELYGRYLTALVRDALAQDRGALRLRLVPDEVVDLGPSEQAPVLILGF